MSEEEEVIQLLELGITPSEIEKIHDTINHNSEDPTVILLQTILI